MPDTYKRVSSNGNGRTVIIGILSVGEHQLQKLIDQLTTIPYNIEIYIFDTFDNATAHQKLYRLFNEKRDHLRIKLDADMTIEDLAQFKKEIVSVNILENRCHIYQVYDFFTQHTIFGVHFYSPQFMIDVESINFTSAFVDQFCMENVQLVYNSFINHGEDHTLQQLTDFIIHRLRKAFQSRDIKKKIKYIRNAYRASPTIYTFCKLFLNQKVYNSDSYKELHQLTCTEESLARLNFIKERK